MMKKLSKIALLAAASALMLAVFPACGDDEEDDDPKATLALVGDGGAVELETGKAVPVTATVTVENGTFSADAKDLAQERAQDIAEEIAQELTQDIAENLAQERATQKTLETARKLLGNDKLSEREIAEITGLPVGRVLQLQQEAAIES